MIWPALTGPGGSAETNSAPCHSPNRSKAVSTRQTFSGGAEVTAAGQTFTTISISVNVSPRWIQRDGICARKTPRLRKRGGIGRNLASGSEVPSQHSLEWQAHDA